jgi:hypothetical protein
MENNFFKITQKYDELVKEKNFYRLELTAKTDLRKLVKKEPNEFFNLLILVTDVLAQNKETESCLSLASYALDEYEKVFNKTDQELFLNSFIKCFKSMPVGCDKSQLKHKLLKFFESKNISDITIQLHGFYQLFAGDSIINKDFLEGYRYALKSQDYGTINVYINKFLEGFKNEGEKQYFIARLILEIILLKNLPLALKIISNFTDVSNNYQNNHQIVNFAYLLIALLSKESNDFDKFWTFINLYKDSIEVDPQFVKYLNKISLLYYSKAIIQEQGFNIMNLLKAFN